MTNRSESSSGKSTFGESRNMVPSAHCETGINEIQHLRLQIQGTLGPALTTIGGGLGQLSAASNPAPTGLLLENK